MFGTKSSFSAVYLANAVFFPVLYIATVFASSNFTSRLFSIGSPWLAEIPHKVPVLSIAVLSCISALASIFIVKPLPQASPDASAKGEEIPAAEIQ